MGKKNLGIVLAVALLVVLGGGIWFSSANAADSAVGAGPKGQPAASAAVSGAPAVTGPRTGTAEPSAPAAAGAPAAQAPGGAASGEAGTVAPGAATAPADQAQAGKAQPDQAQAGKAQPDQGQGNQAQAPSATTPAATAPADPASLIPAHAVRNCSNVRTVLAAFRAAGGKAGPDGLRELLLGLDDFSTNVEAVAGNDDSLQAVVRGISDVRRQWSTALSDSDGGVPGAAAKAKQDGFNTLQGLVNSLACH